MPKAGSCASADPPLPAFFLDSPTQSHHRLPSSAVAQVTCVAYGYHLKAYSEFKRPSFRTYGFVSPWNRPGYGYFS